MAELNAECRESLLAVLMGEYGGERKDWISMRSLARLEREIDALIDRHVTAAVTQALNDAADAIGGSFPLNGELRPNGSTDPEAAAYVEGLHDAWQIVRSQLPRAT